MSKPKLILVHGMGQHTADSFKQDFITACQDAFRLYPSLANKSVGDFVDPVPVGYNDIFDQHREQMANRASPILDRLQQIPGMGGDLGKAAQEITKIESTINDEEFFKTHWLDVIFYRFTTLGENVRIRVARTIADAISATTSGSAEVHVLGHSLGTAVVHDTLAKLYKANQQLGDVQNLDVGVHKLGSLHLVANTSRVLESFVKVDRSVVKPGEGGCTSQYNEYRHKLDPITWPRSFDPTDNGSWISNDAWAVGRYQLIQPTALTNEHGNTHSLHHYIFNPLVHLELFFTVFNIELSPAEIDIGHQRFIDRTLAGVADNLKKEIDKLKKKDLESVKGLVMAVKTLQEFIKKLGGQFDE